MSGRTKIAIVGTQGFRLNAEAFKVESVLWEDLDKLGNIRDYDALILCAPTPGAIKKREFERRFNTETTVTFMKSGATIVLVGDPRIKWNEPDAGEVDFLEWTGFDYYWDSEPGDTIELSDIPYHQPAVEYLTELRAWKYSLASVGAGAWDFLLSGDDSDDREVIVAKDVYCRNRYGHDLAFNLRPVIKGHYERDVYLEGYFVFLPRTERTLDEDIQVILTNFCGVEADLPEPEWLANYAAPGQSLIDEEISKLEDQIENLRDSVRTKLEEREVVRIPLRLLYDRGESLEEAVRTVLAALGAEVRQPDEPGKEDGWIRVAVGDEVLQGVIEVKSTRKDQFNIGGLRQLLEWIQRGVERDRVRYKGVFIGNSGVEKVPEHRRNPFSKDWRTTAELQGLAAITAEDLYELYLLDADNKLDRGSFWRQLFDTKGVFDVNSFRTSPKQQNSDPATKQAGENEPLELTSPLA